MNETNKEIWIKLQNYGDFPFVSKDTKGNNKYKRFLIKICRNDLDYLKKHIADVIDTTPSLQENTLTRVEQIFSIACAFSSDIKIIDFFVEKLQINVTDFRFDTKKFNPKFGAQRTCLMFSCMFNTELSISRHLIEYYHLDPEIVDEKYSQNCLHCAAKHNTSIELIKYLVEERGIDPNKLCLYRDNCLTLSCWLNKNFEIIKYFVEKCKMNIYHYDTNYDDSVILLVKRIIKNEMKIEDLIYLLEHNDIQGFGEKVLPLVDHLVPHFAHNYKILNEILEANPNNDKLNSLVNDIVNPLMISISNRLAYDIVNPFDRKWDEYVKMVDELKCTTPIDAIFDAIDTCGTVPNNDEKKMEADGTEIPRDRDGTEISRDRDEPDYTKQTQILFKHNGIQYYGDPCVYRSMLFLRDIVECADFSEVVELEINDLPRYAVNHYVDSLHTRTHVNIDRIKSHDFIPFIRFIDRYPTVDTSIDRLEFKILKYINDNMLDYNQFLKDISVRYRFRYMYLDIRRKEIEKIDIKKHDLV